MKKAYLTFLAIPYLFYSLTLMGQQHECGTDIADVDPAYLEHLNQKWIQFQNGAGGRAFPTTMTYVPVQLHIIRQTAGTGGIDPTEFEAALERVNAYYAYANIHFYQCNAINYIDDNTYYNYDKSEMNALDAAHSVNNVINIYSTENVTSGASSICGHAQFPGGLDFVMLANSCTLNGSTFEHELGHYFGLYHTHETFYGNELVNGSNCTTTGDLLCDTPADPRLSGLVNANGCSYTGTGTDGMECLILLRLQT